MTESTTPAAVPAGWYPTAAGSPELRWWDGTQWTNHSHTLGVDSGQPLRAPDGTRTGTAWIWIFALLPLVQLAEIPLYSAFYARVFGAGFQNSTALVQAEYAPNSGYWAIQGLGILLYGVYVVLAALDHRALRARGVPRPFHWAWTFLSAIVYMIGRAVVVRRRTGSGLAPLFVNIAALLVTIIGLVAILVPIVATAATSLQ
jgi:hypothetical protein